MRLRRFLLLASVVAMIASLPACLCGRIKERLAEKAAEAAVEAASDDGHGGRAKIDLKKGTLSFKNDKGESVKFEAGGGAKMPDNWPQDFPVVPHGKINLAVNTDKGSTVTFETADPPAKVLEYYAKEMAAQGWKINLKSQTDQGGMLSMTKKPKRSAMVMIGSGGGKTSVTLSAATGK
jgi:hypothetical protein